MLKICTKVSEIQSLVAAAKRDGRGVGFVPTMGALHAGHISLIQRAKAENDIVIASIFVNPTQFNDKQDYALYPRTLGRDSQMLEESGCDILFAPPAEEVYPDESYKRIDFVPGPVAARYEGASRPGHFAGVAAVVKRLFDIVQPDKAYFGQKDYQQYLVISEMAAYYQLPVKLVLCPIVREPNGLAMSSRNERLSPELRQEAGQIHTALERAAREIKKGQTDAASITQPVKDDLAGNRNFTVDYFDICSAKTLEPLQTIGREPVLICTAVIVGGVRLIDNLIAGEENAD
jgi:pantoate--beta-alanine ligase